MTPSNAIVEMINVDGQRIMKLTAQPAWKSSKDSKAMVGTKSCKAKHLGIIFDESITCSLDDGSEITYRNAFCLN